MKSKIRNSFIAATFVAALCSASALSIMPVGSVKAQNQRNALTPASKSKALEGTWRVVVSLQDCQSGQTVRTFPAFLTFAKGGTLVETTAGFSPSLRSPGHGLWEHNGGSSFHAVSHAFLFNPAGVWIGTQTITQAIEMSGSSDELTSNASIEIVDTNGNVLSTGCATAVAQRAD